MNIPKLTTTSFLIGKWMLSIAILLAALTPAHADQMTYIFSGFGSGDLGSLAFNNQAFTITSTADTSQIIQVSAGIYSLTNETSTISISGLGKATFTIPTISVDNENNHGAGISAVSENLAILFDTTQAFANYDLSTPIGPDTGTPTFNRTIAFGTSEGNFQLTSVSSVTFQAIEVPDQSWTLGLLALAFGGCLWSKRLSFSR